MSSGLKVAAALLAWPVAGTVATLSTPTNVVQGDKSAAKPATSTLPGVTYLRDEVMGGGVMLCAVSVKDPAVGDEFDEPHEGKKLVAVRIVLGNAGKERVSINPLYTTLVDQNGAVYEGRLEGGYSYLEALEISPGERTQGWVTFETPEQSKPARLKYKTAPFEGETLVTNLTAPPDGYVARKATLPKRAQNFPPLDSAATSHGYVLGAVAVEDPVKPQEDSDKPKPGFKYVAVAVGIGNGLGEKLDVNQLFFQLIDTDGFVYAASLFGHEGLLGTAELSRGENKAGWVPFHVPEKVKVESIRFAIPFSKWSLHTGLTK
jgi:hypothetical protein